jgi:hypothetical protein
MRRIVMPAIRLALAGAAVLAAFAAPPAAAEIYRPWCAQYTTGASDGATNCGFISYEQCMMTARGAGAVCVQNPWYLWYGSGQNSDQPAPPARRRPR